MSLDRLLQLRIAALPEAFKAIVPIELKADPDKLAEWFARASAAGAFKVAAGIDINTNPGKRVEPLTADEARLARVYQLDPDNADDAALRANRLALVARVRALFSGVADLSRLPG